MSAIEASVEMFRNICQLTETEIESHFKKIDESCNNSNTLHVSDLADNIASKLCYKYIEVAPAICIYLRNRSDLEIRNGKNGGICRINDDRVKIPMTPKDCALKFYDSVKECAPYVIDNAFSFAEEKSRNNGQLINKIRLNFQDLCVEISSKLELVKIKAKPYAVYHCLKKYIEEERSNDLVIALGRRGGLMKK